MTFYSLFSLILISFFSHAENTITYDTHLSVYGFRLRCSARRPSLCNEQESSNIMSQTGFNELLGDKLELPIPRCDDYTKGPNDNVPDAFPFFNLSLTSSEKNLLSDICCNPDKGKTYFNQKNFDFKRCWPHSDYYKASQYNPSTYFENILSLMKDIKRSKETSKPLNPPPKNKIYTQEGYPVCCRSRGLGGCPPCLTEQRDEIRNRIGLENIQYNCNFLGSGCDPALQ